MLIPQFTLRKLLAAMAACGLFFLAVSLAVAGSKWAIGISLAVAWPVLMLLIYALAFSLVWLFSLLPFGRGAATAPFAGSPFAPVHTGTATLIAVGGPGESPFAPAAGDAVGPGGPAGQTTPAAPGNPA